MTYTLVPQRFINPMDLYRIMSAIPMGVRARVIDIRDGYVVWERLP